MFFIGYLLGSAITLGICWFNLRALHRELNAIIDEQMTQLQRELTSRPWLNPKSPSAYSAYSAVKPSAVTPSPRAPQR